VENNGHIIVLTMNKENYNITACGNYIWLNALTKQQGFKELETMLVNVRYKNEELELELVSRGCLPNQESRTGRARPKSESI
jgi:hypothetical protein